MAIKNQQLCNEVRQKIAKWDKAFTKNADKYHDYNQFIFVQQWTDREQYDFENYGKRPLTVNKMATLVNHLLGEQRENTPNLEVVPREKASVENISIREAILKDIMFASDSRVIYQTAFQQAVVGGFGAFYVDHEYCDSKTFDQRIIIDSIQDPTLAYWDMSAKSPNKTDGMYAGFKVRMSRAMLASRWGSSVANKVQKSYKGGGIDYGNGSPQFVYEDEDMVTVIHHFERHTKFKKVYKLSDGRVVDEKEFAELPREIIEEDGESYEIIMDENGAPLTVEAERKAPFYTIKRYKLVGDYELESSEFPAEQLPVIFVDQHSIYDKEGRMITRPFMQDVRDSQVYLNYLTTQSAYVVKTMRFDQFIMSKDNARSQDTQSIWQNPSLKQGALYYDETESGARPEQLPPPQLSPALQQQIELTLMNIQSSTGIYEAKLGQQGNEISGVAINARARQSSYATYVPFDSLNRAIWTCGEIINEMIPSIYDTERTLMLPMENDRRVPVRINEATDPYHGQVKNNLMDGDYKIYLQPGLSFEGQKELALKSLQQVLSANPQTFNMIADLYAENLPLPNSNEIRNRLKTLVPPDIIEAGKTGRAPPPKPQQPDPMVMLQMQTLQLKDKELQQKQMQLQQRLQESERDDMIRLKEIETERLEIAAKLNEQVLRYDAETGRTNADLDIAHANNLLDLITHKRS